MKNKLLEVGLEQLSKITSQWKDMLSRSEYEDVSDLSDFEVISLINPK